MTRTRQVTAAMVLLVTVGLGVLWARSDDTVKRSQAFYAARPRFEQPVAWVEKMPAGLKDLSAKSCGACHQAIYQEWSISTHRRAWEQDAQFQEELKKSRGNRDNPSDVGWPVSYTHLTLPTIYSV